MADEELDFENQESDINPKPDYITTDRKEREAFLSQIGNFTTEEREIFHLICDNWESELGYAKFVTKITKKHPIEEKFLQSLLQKLSGVASGVLLTKYVRGERGVDKIILTNPESRYFYFYYINNEYQKCLEDVSIEFVSEKTFETNNISYTNLQPMNLKIEDFNKVFMKSEMGKMNIFEVVLEGYPNFLTTSVSIQDILKVSTRKVKYYFNSDNFIAFIAKIMNTSISKIRTILNNFDISSWKNFTVELLKNKTLINGRFKNVNSNFFVSLYILYNYCTNELKQKDKDLEDEKKLKETLKIISNKIREQEFQPLDQEKFNKLFDGFNEASAEIKAKFYESFVDNKSKTGLTEIVFVGQHYIHQDNLYKVFLDQLTLEQTNFHSYFIDEYKKCLFSNSSDPTLMEGLVFDSTILGKLQDDNPVLYDMFTKKKFLAESIIQFCKKKSLSQGKMHNTLSLYFVPGTSELKRLSSIFNLNPVDLFEEAYSELPAVKRFFIFILGRRSKVVERYTGYKKLKKNKKKNSNDYSYSKLDETYNSYVADYTPRSSRIHKSSDDTVKSRRKYNKNEIDSAWSSLGNEISKKKRT